MSDWTDLGLPSPQKAGYAHDWLLGLIRTPFGTAHPRQSKFASVTGKRFSCVVYLSTAQLRTLTTALDANGFTWFTMPIVNGSALSETDETVRCIADYKVDPMSSTHYRVTLFLEQKPPT